MKNLQMSLQSNFRPKTRLSENHQRTFLVYISEKNMKLVMYEIASSHIQKRIDQF